MSLSSSNKLTEDTFGTSMHDKTSKDSLAAKGQYVLASPRITLDEANNKAGVKLNLSLNTNSASELDDSNNECGLSAERSKKKPRYVPEGRASPFSRHVGNGTLLSPHSPQQSEIKSGNQLRQAMLVPYKEAKLSTLDQVKASMQNPKRINDDS